MWLKVTDLFKSFPERSVLVEILTRRFSEDDMNKSPAFCDFYFCGVMFCDLRVTDGLASLPGHCYFGWRSTRNNFQREMLNHLLLWVIVILWCVFELCYVTCLWFFLTVSFVWMCSVCFVFAMVYFLCCLFRFCL